jgi:hypothetical protein
MDLDRVFAQTGAKKVFVITDYFRAAKSNADVEFKQGHDAIDTAKAAGVDHLIFMSVADAEFFDEHTKHLKAKVALKKSGGGLIQGEWRTGQGSAGDADFPAETVSQGPAPHVPLLQGAQRPSRHTRSLQKGRA